MTAPALTLTPSVARVPEARRRADSRRPALFLLLLAALLFGGFAARAITAPFGDSHDGRNAGVWASGGRSLLEQGPLASRLGTRSAENGVYANHPPLLYVETAAFRAIGGGTAAATRAPAWLGSILALGLLTALLLEAGLRPAAVGAAVVLVAATPMLLVYGAMLDTPVTSLPFGLAVLLLWQRARRGRPVPWPVAGGITALAVLSGWQSVLVAAVVGGWALVRLLRGSGSRRSNAAFAGGAVVGTVLATAWMTWAFGGTLRPLVEQFRVRTGGATPIPLRQLLAALGHDTATMFGVVGVVAAVGLVLAVADRRTRGLATIALAVTLPYPVLFRSGTVNHDYWTFWFLVPIAFGVAAGSDRILRRLSATGRRDVPLAATAALVAIVLTTALWARPNAPAWAMQEGRRAGTAAGSRTLAADQESAWYAGAVGKPAAWLALATRRPAVSVAREGLAGLAAARPRDLVLVGRLRCIDGEPHIDYSFETAAGVAARPPEIGPCRASGAVGSTSAP